MMQAHRVADAYARLAELIMAQVDALDRDEIETLDVLGRQRAQLADEIEAIGLDPSDPGSLAEVRRQMATCLEADMHLRQRLEVMHQENVVGTRRVDRWRKSLSVYARGMPGAVAIDVKP
jgi:hypothetical protein